MTPDLRLILLLKRIKALHKKFHETVSFLLLQSYVVFFLFFLLNQLPTRTTPLKGRLDAWCVAFLDVKNDVLTRITEPSNNDYNNDGSDNCDHYFGDFDDFGVKNDQKVSHNMILMSK